MRGLVAKDASFGTWRRQQARRVVGPGFRQIQQAVEALPCLTSRKANAQSSSVVSMNVWLWRVGGEHADPPGTGTWQLLTEAALVF
jgi:hypothetical protein